MGADLHFRCPVCGTGYTVPERDLNDGETVAVACDKNHARRPMEQVAFLQPPDPGKNVYLTRDKK